MIHKYKFRLTAVFLVLLGVSGCVSTADPDVSKSSGVAMDKLEAARQEAANEQIQTQVMAPTPLSVPRNATWLSNNVTAAYDELPASLAIKAISGNRPVRFTFPVTHDPLVRNTVNSSTIKDHLDSIMTQSNWIYTVEQDSLTVSDIETKTFQIALQPGTKTATVGFRNLGASASGSGSSDNALQLTLNPYDGNVLEVVNSTLGLTANASGDTNSENDFVFDPGDNAFSTESAQSISASVSATASPQVDPRTSAAILPSGNIMVVTAKPDKMRTVERILEAINKASSTLVRLDLTLYDVDLSDSNSRSIDLSLANIADGNDLFELAVTPVVDTINSATTAFEIVDGQFSGSRAVFNWLNTKGDTSVILSDEVTVLNNQVGSVGDTQTRQFVASVTDGSSSSDDLFDVTTAPTIEKDELRTGIELHVQPTVVNGRVIVRLSLSRSALIAEEAYSFADGAIAGTNLTTDDYNRVITIELKDGVTRLITSQTSQESITSRSRVPWLPWIGDGSASRFNERQTVMLMTASILKR